MKYDKELQRECQEKLDALLFQLMESELSSQEEVDTALEKLKGIYLDGDGKQNGFRHNYSNATSAMFSLDFEGDGSWLKMYEFYAAKIQTLVSNIGTIRDKAVSNGEDELLMPLMKLYDHVNLELVRAGYYARINGLQDGRFGILSSQIAQSRDEAEQSIANAENNAKKLIEDSKAETQRDNITVLGIFTGIVVAFVAGMTFSSSVLQNIDKASIYRLGAMTVIVAMLFLDLVALLIWFLSKVAKIDIGDMKSIVTRANIALCVLLALIVVARFLLLLPPYPQP